MALLLMLCRRELAHICMQVGNRRRYNCKVKRREDDTAGKDSSLFAALGLVQKRTIRPCPALTRDGKCVII